MLIQQLRRIKEQQIKEASAAVEALQKARSVTETRRDYYRDVAFVNEWETAHLGLMAASCVLQAASQVSELSASMATFEPDIYAGALAGLSGGPITLTKITGGSETASSLQSVSKAMNILASIASTAGTVSATIGGYQWRSDEHALQKRVADRELNQIDSQIVGANIRLQIALWELDNHDKLIDNAKAVEDLLRSKYTNEDLYTWMMDDISTTYFQCYQMAYDLAKKAERAFRFERGLTESNFIQFGYWDSLQKGLLAGERVYLALKQMERAYHDQNKREYELTKHISLVLHDPMALIRLKETGQCEFELPEALFDVDYPGHYMRRIKSVSLTIPCVVGPFQASTAPSRFFATRRVSPAHPRNRIPKTKMATIRAS